MKRRIPAILMCLLLCLPAARASLAGSRPNILLILADDMGWSDIGCYGGEIKTPNIDALAAGGLKFTQFYNCARCCPSRASLLTGLYPQQAGVGSMTGDRGPHYPGYRGALQADTATLAEVLRSAGYKTYMAGKWHLQNGTFDVKPTDRGFDEFYGMLGGFNSCWQEHPYYTRWPKDRVPRAYTSAKDGKPGTFYSTDAFADYSLDFLRDARSSGKPFFLYLAFNAVHFPLHAPAADIAQYEKMYFEKGWDVIREERLARQKELGIVPADLRLTPRSIVPAKSFARQSPFAGKQNPAWDTLPEDRRRDLARRMAIYAGMLDHMDQAIGRVVNDLKKHGEFENTLILFLSDNGADWEWDPFGFDKESGPKNILHTGEDLRELGGPDSYCSYGSAWAGACNTPWRFYKHFDFEGGVRTPLVVHWPDGLKKEKGLRPQVGHIMDIMPTLAEVAGAKYPAERAGLKIPPEEGRSLLPAFAGKPIARDEPLFFEHEGSRGVRDGDWKLVSLSGNAWELHNFKTDPSEMTNLIAAEPVRSKSLIAKWEAWARRCSVDTTTDLLGMSVGAQEVSSEDSLHIFTPAIANREIVITCEVTPDPANPNGVILAQGGRDNGYALHISSGQLIFSVRETGLLTSIQGRVSNGTFSVEAKLERGGKMSLSINRKPAITGKAPGLIRGQPLEILTVAEDSETAVGHYRAPNAFRGKVEKLDIQTIPAGGN